MRHRAVRWLTAVTATFALAGRGGAQAESPLPPHPVQAIVGQLAQRYRVPVLLDPEVTIRARPELPSGQLDLPKALDRLCARLPGAGWRRVYLPKSPRNEPPRPERLGALVRIFNRMAPNSLGVERPSGAGLARFERTQAAAAVEETQLRMWGLEPEPLYLIYSTTSSNDGRPPEARMADFQRQQLALAIPEDQLGLSKVQVVTMMQRLPKADMERLATNTVAASYQLWDATPPAQREAMMQQTMRQIERFQPSPAQGGTHPPAPRSGGKVPNRLGELIHMTRSLAAPDEARFIFDPTLLVVEAPKPPAAGAPLPKALDALVQPLSGVGWRHLQTVKATAGRPDTSQTVAGLCDALRSLEGIELSAVAFQDPGGTTTRYRFWAGRDQELPAARDPRWDERPVYAVFNTITGAEGRTLEERLSRLQWQQFQTMFQMSPQQLTRSMEDAFRSYESASPAMQERLLALPLMSGMMAGWFPRHAKESGRAGQ